MTITNGYCTLAEFRQRYFPQSTNYDGLRDAEVEKTIQAASRKVDKHCNRHFYCDTADGTKYYTAPSSVRVYIDDLVTLTTLYTDDDGDGTYENTWAATDYHKLPANSPDGWPYTWLEVTPEGNYSFPRNLRNGVKIIGTFGWAAVPEEVREATLITANRYWNRHGAPFGVMGANEFGVPVVITKLDPDVIELLAPYVRLS